MKVQNRKKEDFQEEDISLIKNQQNEIRDGHPLLGQLDEVIEEGKFRWFYLYFIESDYSETENYKIPSLSSLKESDDP